MVGLNNIYGAGNEADFNGNVTVNVLGGRMKRLFGGANNANIHGNITVNVYGGDIDEVFGGNNAGGYIFGNDMDGTLNENNGNITVNIDIEPSSCPQKRIGFVYGGGKDASYRPDISTDYEWMKDDEGQFIFYSVSGEDTTWSPTLSFVTNGLRENTPVVNVISGTVDTAVFGGGYGATATVKANPKVVIGADRVQQWNGTKTVPLAPSVPNNPVTIGSPTHNPGSHLWGNVFGGGNAARVEGNTSVYIYGISNVKNNVYGGGNAATVNGSTHVTIGETTCE